MASRAGAKRCTECRRWFTPADSAVKTQGVCGDGCRKARRRKLSRRRRSRCPHAYRVDERLRQQAHRDRLRQGECHAPPSAAKSLNLQKEIREMVDEALALSRTSLKRGLPRILARAGSFPWTDRSGRGGADVTHHPLTETSINLARFRCKGGRGVTHQPGLPRPSLIAIAPWHPRAGPKTRSIPGCSRRRPSSPRWRCST